MPAVRQIESSNRVERHRRIAERYLEGNPIAEIAAAEGVDRKTVRNVARRAQLPLRLPPRAERNALHGVIPRKTKGFAFSNEAANQPAVWLGLFDGDGYAAARHNGRTPRIDFYGPRSVMQQCAEFWASRRVLKTGRPPAVARHSPRLYMVRLYSSNAARAAQVMLAASVISMKRKRKVLEEIAAYQPMPRRRGTVN